MQDMPIRKLMPEEKTDKDERGDVHNKKTPEGKPPGVSLKG
jgi:hypothetical protein